MAEHGEIVWSELNTHDVEAAKRFYGATIGWTFDGMDMAGGRTYWVAKTGGKMAAGLFLLAGPEFEGVPDHWLTYVEIDDVDRRVAEIAGAGGTVLRALWTVPGVGRIAIIRDPGDAVVGWMTSEEMPDQE